MGMVLTEEQSLLKTTAQEYFQTKAPVEALRKLRDTKDAIGFCPDGWAEICELGWAGIVFPEQYHGLDFGYVGLGCVMEESGRTLAASPLFATVALAGNIILGGGTEQQKLSLLPGIVAGDLTMALALEEGGRHSIEGTQLSAEPSGGGYILNGSKTFVLDGHSADKLVVVSRTKGQAGERKGLSLFVVDTNTPGIECERLSLIDSRNVAKIRFSDVTVDATALVGPLHCGADVLEPALDRARILLAAEMLGGVEACFERTLNYLKEREQFGQKIGSFQALKHRASKMFTEIELCKAVVQAALSAIEDQPSAVPMLASLAKARLNDTALLVTNEAVQMHGGIGVTDELEVGFFLKRARVAIQVLGDSHFHRDRFASLARY